MVQPLKMRVIRESANFLFTGGLREQGYRFRARFKHYEMTLYTFSACAVKPVIPGLSRLGGGPSGGFQELK